MKKTILLIVYFLAAIIFGGFTGIGSVVFYKITTHKCPEKLPAELYKELFIQQALPWAQRFKQEGNTLSVSDMLALAANRSSFGHYPEDPGDCVINILGESDVSEYERELIREMNLTQYDTLTPIQ